MRKRRRETKRSDEREREKGEFGKFAASLRNNFVTICDSRVVRARGCWWYFRLVHILDTLHYAGVNVYSLRLVATDGRLRRRTARDISALLHAISPSRVGFRLRSRALWIIFVNYTHVRNRERERGGGEKIWRLLNRAKIKMSTTQE